MVQNLPNKYGNLYNINVINVNNHMPIIENFLCNLVW